MKNPLYKRIKRELKDDIGKYIALFLFLLVTIGFCSGFLVGDGNLKAAYDESFGKYNVEDGHFSLAIKADNGYFDELEKSQNINVYELFSNDRELENGHTIRFFKDRKSVNKIDIFDGEMPESDSEIAMDRLYCENNNISIGDRINVDGKSYKLTATVALTDYSALFKNNSDMMFDANKFCVAVVTDSAFEKLNNSSINYRYAWTNNEKNLTEKEAQDKADNIKDELIKCGAVTDFLPQADNQAIKFTGEDMGGDKVMVEWILYIVMAVLAFVFAVTTRNTIEKESGVIGTLRASGYTKGELFRHYLILPVMITIISAIFGNICGYTFMQKLISGLYYHSYSLTPYNVVWSSEAFFLTTLVPVAIILVVNVLVLLSSLSLSPLQYLRHNLKKGKSNGAVKLPNWKFLKRFRARIILQNKSTYFLMFIGIFLASVLLMFGLMFSPLLDSFKEEVIDSKISNYQYILKTPVETKNDNAEKYCVTTLKNDNGEEITVYGITEKSKFIKDIEFSKHAVYLSDGYMEKYGIKADDKVTLNEDFDNKDYTFTVKGKYNYPAAMAVFMPRDMFNKTFDKDKNYFTGYFANERLSDIDEILVATIITQDDLTVMADQLNDSIGMVFPMFGGFAVILFVLVIYLLAKIIIEKNAQSISMVKILGYSSKEASKLYNRATALVVAISLVICLPVSYYTIRIIYYIMMQKFTGWLTFYVAPWVFPEIVLIGLCCYFIVHLIHNKRISRIPMSQALKDME